jgi:hypothetical protein
MLAFLRLFVHVLAAPFRTQAQLEAEITMLRHDLSVLRRQAPARPRLTAGDRLLFVWLCRLFPSLRSAITIGQPDTVLCWHRSGFRAYWRHRRPRRPEHCRRIALSRWQPSSCRCRLWVLVVWKRWFLRATMRHPGRASILPECDR